MKNNKEEITTDSNHTPEDIEFEVTSRGGSQAERISDNVYENYKDFGYLGVIRIKVFGLKVTAGFRTIYELKEILTKYRDELKWEKLPPQ